MSWMRANLFSSPLNTALSLGSLYLLWLIIPPVIDWAFLSAVWVGEGREDCLGEGVGACWPFVTAKWQQFIYGRYPTEELWRVNLTFVIGAVSIVMALREGRFRAQAALFAVVIFPALAFVLLSGGMLGLAEVGTELWGGLLVTLVVAVTGIAASLPLGIALALARRSELPIIRWFAIAFIEFWRGVPLITVLFMAAVMLPLFLPDGVTFDKLLRCLIGVALFASAYMAEVIRGGLQAIPKGQYEAANAMALTYWQGMRLIILPQALKLVIPGIVNTFIGLFKDTSLVLIIGIFDLLGIVQQNFTDTNWISPATPATGLVFAAFVYFIFCFGMSRYSAFMERRLDTGHKR